MLTIYAAGAGTGKTYRIVEDMVDFVAANQGEVHELAAITYTNAAASEISNRLRRRLMERSLFEQAEQVEAAYISTIHSFCFRLLKEHPLYSKLTPSVSILDELEAKIILRNVLGRTLQQHAELAAAFNYIRDNMVIGGYQFNRERIVEQEIITLIEQARSINKRAEDFLALCRENQADIKQRLPKPLSAEEVIERLARVVALWEQFRAEYVGEDFKYLQRNDQQIQRVKQAISKRDIGYEAIGKVKFGSGKKALGSDQVRAEMESVLEPVITRNPHELARMEKIVGSYYLLAKTALKHYEDLKEANQVLDYTDLEVMALELLTNQVEEIPFLKYLQGKIGLLLVDEFQDTSPIQFRLFELLRRGSQIPTVYVGDLKQAIYGFRRADSQLMQALWEDKEQPHQRKQLDKNWRSRPELVDLINQIFQPLLAKYNTNYDKVTPHSIYARNPLVDHAPIEIVSFPEAENEDQRNQGIAIRIRDMLNEKIQVWDTTHSQKRELLPKDIAVLARDNPTLDKLAQALGGLGIPSIREQQGFFSSLPVQLFIALVKGFSNLKNTQSLATILVSELYGISFQAVQQIACVNGLSRLREIHYQGGDNLSEDLRQAIDDLEEQEREQLKSFVADAVFCCKAFRQLPMVDAIRELMARTDFVQVMLYHHGVQAEANVQKIQQLVADFCEMPALKRNRQNLGAVTPEGLLDYFTKLNEANLADEQPTPRLGVAGGVNLITVHRSKGLEFPIVLWVSGHKQDTPKLPSTEVIRPAKALLARDLLDQCSLRYYPATKVQQLASLLTSHQEYSTRQEQARLLYVALTRARERLSIVWRDKVRENSFQDMLVESGFSWHPPSLVVNGKQFAASHVEVQVEDFSGYSGTDGVSPPPQPMRQAFRAAISNWDIRESATAGKPRLLEITPSHLGDYLDCPAQYHLLHHMGVDYWGTSRQLGPNYPMVNYSRANIPDIHGMTQQALGNLVHQAMYLLSPVLFGEQTDEYANQVIARLAAGYPSMETAVRDYLISSFQGLKSLFAERKIHAHQAEVPVIGEIEATHLAGTIDLVFADEQGWHLIDYKVIAGDANRKLPAYAAHYLPQLEIYASCFLQSTGIALVDMWLVFVNLATAVQLPIKNPLRPQVITAMRGIATGQFPRNPKRDCGICPYKKECKKAL